MSNSFIVRLSLCIILVNIPVIIASQSLFKQEIIISQPIDKELVTKEYLVRGEGEIGDDKYLWILLSRYDFVENGFWFPQGRAKIRKSKYKLKVNFGNDNDVGECFHLIVISVYEPDHLRLSAYMRKAISEEHFPPIHLASYIRNFSVMANKVVIRA